MRRQPVSGMTGWARIAALATAIALCVPLTACSSPTDLSASDTTASQDQSSQGQSGTASSGDAQSSGGEVTATTDPGAGQTATDVLATLPVKGRAPKTGYSRDRFGAAWADVDHNGCDTRNDILNRDLTDKTYKAGTHDCVVTSGTLADPYTGTIIDFVRGQDTSSAVQIDHVVALSDAWQKGAQQLSDDLREQLANDPYNLLAVDGPSNQQKSDGDAATWLPANKSFRCAYVARQIGVKHKYSLWVTQSEHDAMANVLSSCPGQQVPEHGGADGDAVAGTATGTDAGADDADADGTAGTSSGDVYYKNCAAARAAGAAPLTAGQPGYRAGLDRDGDGVACE